VIAGPFNLMLIPAAAVGYVTKVMELVICSEIELCTVKELETGHK
jgi:hypothetical protein